MIGELLITVGKLLEAVRWWVADCFIRLVLIGGLTLGAIAFLVNSQTPFLPGPYQLYPIAAYNYVSTRILGILLIFLAFMFVVKMLWHIYYNVRRPMGEIGIEGFYPGLWIGLLLRIFFMGLAAIVFPGILAYFLAAGGSSVAIFLIYIGYVVGIGVVLWFEPRYRHWIHQKQITLEGYFVELRSQAMSSDRRPF